MTAEHITDHEARGAHRLTEQFKHQPRIVALLKSWLAQVQQLEDAAYELQLQRTLEHAIGAHLDALGALVGQPREARIDDVYRIWIGARALVNRSSGTTSQLLAIASKLCGDPVWLEELHPAWFTLHAMQPVEGLAGAQVAQLLRLAKPAGVGMHFRWANTPDVFRFSPSGSSAMDSAHGFTAGRLAAVSEGRALYEPLAARSVDSRSALVVVL